MTVDPLFGFIFLGLFSPGPNIILLTASGARFGFVSTVPHVLGVALGVGFTSAATGFGIGTILSAIPSLTLVLKIIACIWILVMAWRLWASQGPNADTKFGRPFTFMEAVLFQWVNPKIWAVALSATAYTAGQPVVEQAWRLGTAFSGINLGVCLFWTLAGTLLSYLLQNAVAWRIFMRSMAILLAVFSMMVFV